MKYNKEQIFSILKDNEIARDIFGGNLDRIVMEALNAYDEKHRYYHSFRHLSELFGLIVDFTNKNNLCQNAIETLQLVALYHDVFYNPKPDGSGEYSNEEVSANRFYSDYNLNGMKSYDIRVKSICDMILETQYGKREGTTALSVIFNEMDLYPLIYGNLNELIKNEMLIFKEYQFSSYSKYKEGRIKFLNFIKNHKLVKRNESNILLLKEYVENYVPNIGIYAGSFNPFHIGHKNILEKASKLFDKVIVAFGRNPDKESYYLDIDKTIRPFIPFYEVDEFTGALSEYIKSVEKYAKVTLVRGLRNGYDFSYEINQLRFIEDMYGGNVSVVFIPCDREYDYISSSAIRSIEKIDGDFVGKYLGL